MRDTFGSSIFGSVFEDTKPSPVRVVGEKIAIEDVRVGDEIRADYLMQDTGDIKVFTSRQGVVHSIGADNRITSKEDHVIYSSVLVGFNRLVLVKAIDEILVEVKAAKPGSVVQIHDGGSRNIVLTYVKSEATQNGAGRWLALDSRYTNTSLLSDTTVRSKMQTLDQLVINH